MAAGIVVGFICTVWTTVHAAALLPSLSLTGVANGSTVSGVITLGANADSTGLSAVQFQVSGQNIGPEITSGSCAASWDTRTVTDGTRTLLVTGRDSVGNIVTSSPVLVTVSNAITDTAAPSVSVSTPSAGSTVTGSSTLLATASDNVGVAGVWFTIDGASVGAEDTATPYQASWASTSVANGAHVVRAFARDAAGNTGSSAAVTVTVANTVSDTAHPTVSVSAPTAGAVVSATVTVSANATDNVGVAGVQFKLDGVNLGSEDTTQPYSVSWTTTTATNASHTITAVARDSAGNTTSSAAVAVTVNNVVADTTMPSVSLVAPSSNSTVTNTVTVTASASDNVGVVGVQFQLDGANLGPEVTSSSYATPWNTTSATNGGHTLRAIARDAAGNRRTSSSRTVNVNNTTTDTIAPSTAVTAPGSSTTVLGNVTLSATATDNKAVTSVQFTIDGVAAGAPDATAPYSFTWASTTVADGSHTVRAVAKDAAGNQGTSSPVLITVKNAVADTMAPVVLVTSPIGGTKVGGNVTVIASATDNVGVIGVQFRIDGISYGAEDTVAPYQITIPAGALPDGSYQLSAVARDAAGNKGASPNVALILSQLVVVVAAPGDLNGDGTPDLVWQNSQGSLYTWLMHGIGLQEGRPVTPAGVDSRWQIVSVDDFDGDGQNDFLWQNRVTGQLYIWLMSGTTLASNVALPTDNLPGDVEATGDFDGDGKADIVWRQPETGDISVWFMNGTQVASRGAVTPARVDPRWQIAGAGDMNRDGKADLIWQNTTTGALQVWLMNGATLSRSVSLTPSAVQPSWRIKAIADFDGDGNVDLVFQNSGFLYIWFMNGTTMTRGSALNPGQVDPNWQLVGRR
ncbi:MAG: Ig-like domain-containing protein [Acidobacteriota bacterium]